MKKLIPTAIGGLLGLMFIVFGANYFLKFISMGDPPAVGTPPALFFGAFVPTGYFAMIKILEIIGGILVAIPKTRNIGLLVLGPIIINILAFNLFLVPGVSGLLQPPVIAISVLSAFLLFVERKKFAGLLH